MVKTSNICNFPDKCFSEGSGVTRYYDHQSTETPGAELASSEQWSVLCDTRGPVWHLSSGHQIITGSAHSDSAASPSLSDLSDIYLFVWCQLYWLHIACRAACTEGSAPCVWSQNMSCLERTDSLGFRSEVVVAPSAFIQCPRFTLFIPVSRNAIWMDQF